MGKCTCHPEKDTNFQCMKHGVFLCDECLACRDPQLYCKHRSACPISFIEKRRKRRKRLLRDAPADAAQPDPR
ncbi:MAG: hypothetical protein ACM3KE_16395 [Hyphomicrobiales bacterium]